jgi:hypothetical protein
MLPAKAIMLRHPQNIGDQWAHMVGQPIAAKISQMDQR